MVEISDRLRALDVLLEESEFSEDDLFDGAVSDIVEGTPLITVEVGVEEFLEQVEPIIEIMKSLNTEERLYTLKYASYYGVKYVPGGSWRSVIHSDLEELFVRVAKGCKEISVNAEGASGPALAAKIAYQNKDTFVKLVNYNENTAAFANRNSRIVKYLGIPNLGSLYVKDKDNASELVGKVDLSIALGPFGYNIGKGTTDDLLTAAFLSQTFSSPSIVLVSDSALFKGGETANTRGMLIQLENIAGVISLDFTQGLKGSSVGTNLLLLESSQPKNEGIYFASNRLKSKVSLDFHSAPINALLRNVDQRDLSSFGGMVLAKTILADNNFILNPERYLATEFSKNLDVLTERYESDYLSNLFDIIRPIPLKNDPDGEYSIKEVMIGDLEDKEIIELRKVKGKNLNVSLSNFVKIKDQIIQENDILFSVKATIGKCSLAVMSERQFADPEMYVRFPPKIDEEVDEDIHISANQGLFILRKKKISPISAETLFAFISSRHVVETLSGKATGSTLKHLPIKILQQLEIPLPDSSIQEGVLEKLRDRAGTRKLIKSYVASIESNIEETWPNLELKSMEPDG